MSTRKAFTPQDLRELAAEPLDEFHPHLLDAMRGALRFCADVIDAANEALRDQSALQAKEAEIAALKEDAARWNDWLPWMRQLNKKPYNLTRLIDSIDSARAAGVGEGKR